MLENVASETMALLRAYKLQGCGQSRDRAIMLNMKLVYRMAHKYKENPNGFEFADLVQYGAIGLIHAVDRFDLSEGVQFSTYAIPLIRGEILHELRDNRLIKLARTKNPKNQVLRELASRVHSLDQPWVAEGEMDFVGMIEAKPGARWELAHWLIDEFREYPRLAMVATDLMHGYKTAEIAEKVGVTQSTISRDRSKIKDIVKGLFPACVKD